MKEFITTGRAAKVCGLSARTICDLFDEGKIAGFKINKDRRILVPAFREYLGTVTTNSNVLAVLNRRLDAEIR